MADLSLIGSNPSSDAGNKFFLHSIDRWQPIVAMITDLLSDKFEIAETVYTDELLVPTPYLDAEQSQKLSNLLYWRWVKHASVCTGTMRIPRC